MGRYRARAWWHVSLGVLVIAGCDPEPAVDGDGHSLGTDTVTTRKTLHVGSVSEFGYGSLHEVTTLRDPGGEIASFGQVSNATLFRIEPPGGSGRLPKGPVDPDRPGW